ncbi:ubiquinone/menaquinone biosynthesis C-methylase UbiE [Chryseobacterium defluvii]|uniref:Ubiquinone/menaquinone biosynthesis C-methylase UbiE n=1 Tax=Chryseobacterium defluvii TaxID=160396 RepID=A0A840KHJ9_9FLAO|nr:class I SAM-dependent methyltransferase [Chryseobacterium defluvii]MBB4807498.1 ubiquinone/menaquinone biosynthesis C-methylase UbiE [Chryseobacterium defluvii]
MTDAANKNHWETVYETKNPNQVSWTQKKPQISLDLINSFKLEKNARIIDIGGGDSNLADFLLEEGYQNITVLDISAKALEKAQKRLGPNASNVTWIEADITEFEPDEAYDLWHDRAAFHFLTKPEHIQKYISTAQNCIKKGMVIGTFSKNGPTKCSGLDILQYDEKSLEALFENGFEKINVIMENHTTPFDTKQNFVFCSFKRQFLIQEF